MLEPGPMPWCANEWRVRPGFPFRVDHPFPVDAIRVEGEQLDELHRAITVARHRFHRQRAESGEATTPAQVIQLPSLF